MPFFARLLLFIACLVPAALRADPSGEQQFWLELVNRARRDPAGELERLVNYASPTSFANPSSDNQDVANALAFYGTSASQLLAEWAALGPAPALAWNDALAVSATTYSQAMYDQDAQSHALDGLSLEERIGAGGYFSAQLEYLDLGETLFAGSKSIAHGHAGFLIDWGDDDGNPGNGFGSGLQTPATHRDALFDPAFKEIGIGWVTPSIGNSNLVATGPYVTTQHLGNRYRFDGSNFFSDAILTGVVFQDTILADAFYTPDEGIAGTLIEIYSQTSGNLLFSGMTNAAGGFNISLQGVAIGDALRISAPGTGLGDQLVSITGHMTDPNLYGEAVTFFDNQYAAFMLVPEPGSLALALLGLVFWRRRRIASEGVA